MKPKGIIINICSNIVYVEIVARAVVKITLAVLFGCSNKIRFSIKRRRRSDVIAD